MPHCRKVPQPGRQTDALAGLSFVMAEQRRGFPDKERAPCDRGPAAPARCVRLQARSEEETAGQPEKTRPRRESGCR